MHVPDVSMKPMHPKTRVSRERQGQTTGTRFVDTPNYDRRKDYMAEVAPLLTSLSCRSPQEQRLLRSSRVTAGREGYSTEQVFLHHLVYEIDIKGRKNTSESMLYTTKGLPSHRCSEREEIGAQSYTFFRVRLTGSKYTNLRFW